jgi:glucosamine--fructose-6-phosphate aminotransferase (isomerizing)
MCGIVGGISERNVVPIILEGLAKLEYRGYDSVGVAVVDAQGQLVRERVVGGRVKQLVVQCRENNLRGLLGIGHTRWATHGGVSQENAHPHFSEDTIAVVHNGIIENYDILRDALKAKGYIFESQTDTEVIAHLIHSLYIKDKNLLAAVTEAVKLLHGAYAIGVISKDDTTQAVCARFGSPLVLGVGINEMFFASDISALLPVTQKVVYLEEGDVAQITLDSYTVFDKLARVVERKINQSELSINHTELGQYRHYMQKEIFEQPQAIADTLQGLDDSFSPAIFGESASELFLNTDRVQIIACGTSYHAGLVAKYWFEEIAGIECSVDIASEYRYRNVPINKKTLVVSISQSGETADTLACIKHLHERGVANTLSICNVAESSLVRLSNLHVLTHAGPEIGVASTKAFTTQLVVLLHLVITIAKVQGRLDGRSAHNIMLQMRHLPQLVLDCLKVEEELKTIAHELEHKEHTLFLGRHTLYPVAIEGALKLKEISYIHAEGYASGELKHGPLALIDDQMPIIVLMPKNILLDKVRSNVQEVLARKGIVYLITDSDDLDTITKCHKTIKLPLKDAPEYLVPILYTIPMQLLAYHTAVIKGTDVDKPRNLAKSVTVE